MPDQELLKPVNKRIAHQEKMQNKVLTFEDELIGRVRVVIVDDEPWFVGKDVAEVLGYANPSKALQDHVDDLDKLNNETLSSLGQRGGWLINESGLYSLIFSSKLPTAHYFKRWVTSDILPTIRKHGGYITAEGLEKIFLDPDNILKMVQNWKADREKLEIAQEQIEADKPKVLFADAVSASDSTILIGELAKILKQNGIDMGQQRLFEWMRENGYLMKCGSSRNMPTQKAMELGLFKVLERTINNPDGSIRITKTPKLTRAGQEYFIAKFMSERDAG